MGQTTRGELVLPRLLFLGVVLAEVVHTGMAMLERRVPSTHDGFQYFTVQYYFLNNAVQANEVAQWIPYMNQGTVATFWYAIQGSFLQSVLLYAGSLLRGADLLFTYHIGMFADEMVLLVGTWLLARRFFRTPAVCFIAVSVMGSCVWLDQPYWNFRLYYALPLVLEMGHRFLDSGRWRWFFLAVNLLALQTVGNLPYFVPFTSFAVFAYFASYATVHHRLVWQRARSLKWGWRAAVAIALGAMCFVVVYKCITVGTEQLVGYNPGRNRDGTSDLSSFLTYGGVTDLRKWIDLVLNVSPWLDITLYAGILLAPLLLCGLAVVDRRRLHLVLYATLLLLFTLATPVAVAAFYVWPGMKFFRHIGLVSPLVKVLFCFVAGIGFEWLFEPHPLRSKLAIRAAATAGALLLTASAWLALHIAGSASATRQYVDALTVADVDRPPHTYEPRMMSRRLRSSANLALAGAAIVGVVPLMLGSRRIARSPLARRTIVCGVLVFVSVDVYRFKFAYLFDRSDVVSGEVRSVVRATPMTYPRRREAELVHAVATSPRLQATLGFNQMLLRRFQGRTWLGAQVLVQQRLLVHRRSGFLPAGGLVAQAAGRAHADVPGVPDRRYRDGAARVRVRFSGLPAGACRGSEGVWRGRGQDSVLRSRLSRRCSRRPRSVDEGPFVRRRPAVRVANRRFHQ